MFVVTGGDAADPRLFRSDIGIEGRASAFTVNREVDEAGRSVVRDHHRTTSDTEHFHSVCDLTGRSGLQHPTEILGTDGRMDENRPNGRS